MNKYYKKALSISKELVANRRTLHNYAETGFDLPRTTTFVMKKLNEYSLSPFPVGKSGICCILGNQGKTILLRADMDALPMKENTGLISPLPTEIAIPVVTIVILQCCLVLQNS